LAVLVGCSSVLSAVRVQTGEGGRALIHIPRTEMVEPEEVPREEVTRPSGEWRHGCG
jgi:hypothetical protein